MNDQLEFTIDDFTRLVVQNKTHELAYLGETDEVLPARMAFLDFKHEDPKRPVTAALTCHDKVKGTYEIIWSFYADGCSRKASYRLLLIPRTIGWISIYRFVKTGMLASETLLQSTPEEVLNVLKMKTTEIEVLSITPIVYGTGLDLLTPKPDEQPANSGQ